MIYIGIDVGSVSTDFVAADENNNVVEKLYLNTEGDPAKAVAYGMEKLGTIFRDSDIGGIGTTGSGRQLAALMTGADTVKNEITAHGTAAGELYPHVRTVFEIGGQDSKIILLKDGLVRDFAMNTLCAAGTGSFLERQAQRMGVSPYELGILACDASQEAVIGGRCAVFAETDIIHRQQMGASAGSIAKGLCRAMVKNYLNNVAKGKKLLPGFCFQGGVSCNEGIRKVLEEEIGSEVMVPEHNTCMGALGAAIIAKRTGGSTAFRGFGYRGLNSAREEFTCDRCPNRCNVILLKAGDEVLGCFQDRCGRYSSAYS